ncbi:3-methyl-2-oxobutanoate hydroxymethyltransferase [hydrothermal vent metagenome]|uniref:3-methyl-2-oxobutanoate hydroxymethyltransferase n=1 Tax=hydrothermal vent metagenome TaxID=652676 RepID=A0A3B1C8U2_9ZZZZ
MPDKMTVSRLQGMKSRGEKISALTAYDYTFARLVDSAGADLVLVGDSLGMVFNGEENTLRVTVDDIAYHVKAVHKGIERALLVADMPFLSCHVGMEKALENAGRLIFEGAEAVKIEGCDGLLEIISKMLSAGIPVMGHIGLTPQSIHKFGGFKIQGRHEAAARRLIDEASKLEQAGVFSIVLECVPEDLSARITEKLRIPTIGIGAGPACDGQILVTADLLGLQTEFKPKFVKKYADLASVVKKAVGSYIEEIKTGAFPDERHCYQSSPKHLKAI